jgi:Flp pilus assembly protein TadD
VLAQFVPRIFMKDSAESTQISQQRFGAGQASFFTTIHPSRVVERPTAGADQLAEAEYRQQLAKNPDRVDVLQALAVLLGARGEFEESAEFLARALQVSPNDPHLHNDLGVTLERAGRFTRAVESYRRSLQLEPRFHQTWTNLANSLLHSGDLAGAQEASRHALQLEPTYAPALNVLGSALVEIGRPAEAIIEFRRAIALSPSEPETHTNYAMALLQCGDFENGLKEYEWRRHRPDPMFQRAGRPWDGSNPQGRTLFLYGEGGLGNMIQFARYIPLLSNRGAKVVVECQAELASLMTGIRGVSRVVPRGTHPGAYDAHCPLASLPALFGTRLDTIPAAVPYLNLDQKKVEKWQSLVQQVSGFRVGVCWKGSRPIDEPRSRSLDPLWLASLSNLPGVSLINLQHGETAPPELRLNTLAGLEPQSMELHDVAAVIASLDLVVSCDTSIAHIAGALGKPVWVVIGNAGSWRWMRDRDDSPWYPTMRLFRQPKAGDWADCIERIAAVLTAPDHGGTMHAR